MVGELRRVAVALGSNQGDREAHLSYALNRLRTVLSELSVSTFIETEPEGVRPQRAFLNAAALGLSRAEPPELLRELQAIEWARGRARPFAGAPRTLDLDLILVGDLVVSATGIEMPHPRFRDRLFVLQPLAEIAPDLVDPVSGLTVGALLAKTGRGEWGA